MKIETKYAIRSNKTGKFLSNLFEDKHAKMFQKTIFSPKECHWYRIEQVAKDIAKQLNGHVVERN